MSTNLEAERYPFELCVEGKTIRQQKLSELLWEISSPQ